MSDQQPLEELRICEFNVENLFISMDYYDGQNLEHLPEPKWRALALAQFQPRQKPLMKIRGVAKAIREIDPHILMLIEVGGQESLENFNHYFLDDRYEVFFVEGNSERQINLGFLVKCGLPYRPEALSNRDTPVKVHTLEGTYVTRLSRDVAELRLHDDDGALRLILLLAHLKSRLSTETDVRGNDIRTAEAIALAGIYEERRKSFPEVPIVVAGDLNAELSSLELEILRRTDLTDFHDVIGTKREDRISLVHFEYSGRSHPQVFDYILVSPQLVDRIVKPKSFTYRYRSFYHVPEDLPTLPGQRYRMPSDHYPVVLTLRWDAPES